MSESEAEVITDALQDAESGGVLVDGEFQNVIRDVAVQPPPRVGIRISDDDFSHGDVALTVPRCLASVGAMRDGMKFTLHQRGASSFELVEDK